MGWDDGWRETCDFHLVRAPMGDVDHTFRVLIETGEMIPAFTLPGSDGMPYSPGMYKQQEHILLLILLITSSSKDRGLLKDFAWELLCFRVVEIALLVRSAE